MRNIGFDRLHAAAAKIRNGIQILEGLIHTKRALILLLVSGIVTVVYALLFPREFREHTIQIGVPAILSIGIIGSLLYLWMRYGKASLIRIMSDNRLYLRFMFAIGVCGIVGMIFLYIYARSRLPESAVLRIMGQTFLESVALAVGIWIVGQIIEKKH